MRPKGREKLKFGILSTSRRIFFKLYYYYKQFHSRSNQPFVSVIKWPSFNANSSQSWANFVHCSPPSLSLLTMTWLKLFKCSTFFCLTCISYTLPDPPLVLYFSNIDGILGTHIYLADICGFLFIISNKNYVCYFLFEIVYKCDISRLLVYFYSLLYERWFIFFPTSRNAHAKL